MRMRLTCKRGEMPAKDGRFYTFTINPRQVKREVKKVEWCKRGQEMA